MYAIYAHFGGSCVSRWDPAAGRRLGTLRLLITNVTSCFCGAAIDRLYITLARTSLTPAQLAADAGVRGRSLHRAPPRREE